MLLYYSDAMTNSREIPIRRSASWMTIWDDRLLELLASDGVMSVSDLSSNESIRIGQSQISRRLSKLYDNNVLIKESRGVYSLNIIGAAYLCGEYDLEKECWIDFDGPEEFQEEYDLYSYPRHIRYQDTLT